MSIFTHIFTATKPKGKPRNRLRKPPKGILSPNSSNYLIRKETVDIAVVQSCFAMPMFPPDTEEADDDIRAGGRKQGKEGTQPHNINHIDKEEAEAQPEIMKATQLTSITSQLSNDLFLNVHSTNEMLDLELVKRTRAKTPCFFIGQLDGKRPDYEEKYHVLSASDPSKTWAGQYQAMLPPRPFTPFSEADSSRPTSPHLGKTLRKIKGQPSLRGLVTCQEAASCISSHSDSETLIGTPTPGNFYFTSSTSLDADSSSSSSSSSDTDNEELPSKLYQEDKNQQDLGFQICMDLLTRELATGFIKESPSESLEEPSGLQILLMIEAYESMQHQIQSKIQDVRQRGEKLDQMKAVQNILGTWLTALYMLCDRLKPGLYRYEGTRDWNVKMPRRRHLRTSSIKNSVDGEEFWIDDRVKI